MPLVPVKKLVMPPSGLADRLPFVPSEIAHQGSRGSGPALPWAGQPSRGMATGKYQVQGQVWESLRVTCQLSLCARPHNFGKGMQAGGTSSEHQLCPWRNTSCRVCP